MRKKIALVGAETIFKAFALALKTACMVDPSKEDILPSTKGLL